MRGGGAKYLLPADGVRLLGVALLMIASQRELTLGKVRPDGLLQALLLFGFASMLAVCVESADRRGDGTHVPRLRVQLGFAAAMGLSFGLAYLTKSFALLVALLSVAALAVFQWAMDAPDCAASRCCRAAWRLLYFFFLRDRGSRRCRIRSID